MAGMKERGRVHCTAVYFADHTCPYFIQRDFHTLGIQLCYYKQFARSTVSLTNSWCVFSQMPSVAFLHFFVSAYLVPCTCLGLSLLETNFRRIFVLWVWSVNRKLSGLLFVRCWMMAGPPCMNGPTVQSVLRWMDSPWTDGLPGVFSRNTVSNSCQ